MIVCINGKYFNKKDAKLPVLDHGILYNDGVFDTIAAVNGKIFWLEEHIERLIKGCRDIYIKVPWTKKRLIALTEKTYRKNNQKNGRIRITITRGENGIPIYGSTGCKPNLIIFSSKLTWPSNRIYQRGAKLLLTKYQRFCPQVKSISFLPPIIAYLEAKKLGYDNALFVDQENNITEGTTFNIFTVKNGRIKTPRKNILPGITAEKVINLARKCRLKTIRGNIKTKELISVDEVFITGTTKKIVPVVQINKEKIGNDKVGPITKKLMQKFSQTYY